MFALLLALAPPAAARESEVLDGGLVLDRWGVEDGLPLPALTGLDLAADGSLWLSTMEGVYRFDGANFERVVEELDSSRVHDLRSSSDGAVWMLAEDGSVARSHQGQLQVWRDIQDKALLVDRGWELLLSRPGPLELLNELEPFAEEHIEGRYRGVGVDEEGGLWLLSEGGRSTAARSSRSSCPRSCRRAPP